MLVQDRIKKTFHTKWLFFIGIIAIAVLLTLVLSSCTGTSREIAFIVDDSEVEKEVEFGTSFPLKGLKVFVKLSNGTIRTLKQGEGGYQVHMGGYNEESPGEYTLTISYKEFDSYKIVITVLEEEIIDETIDPDVYLAGIAVRENTAKILFLYGEEFSADGIVVEKVFSNNTREPIEESEYLLISNNYKPNNPGEYVIEIYYTPSQGSQFYTEYKVHVAPPDEYYPFEGIALLTNAVQKEFEVGEDFNCDGLIVEKLFVVDGVVQTETAHPSEIKVRLVDGYDKNTPGQYAVFVSVEYYEAIYVIEVLDFVVGIRIEGARKHTPVGEEYDKGNLRVYEVYASGTDKEISEDKYTIDMGEFDNTVEGKYTITVVYNDNPEFTASYEVTVLSED